MPYKDKEKRNTKERRYYHKHRDRVLQHKKSYYKDNQNTRIEYSRQNGWKNNLKLLYGLTVEQWQELYDNQKGCCAICGRHQSELPKRLFTDHDHQTGQVRGLLCPGCNLALGIFKNKNVLIKAIEYLDR